VGERRTADTLVPLKDLLGPSLDRIEEIAAHSGTVTGVATGYNDLDHILAGAAGVEPDHRRGPARHGKDQPRPRHARPCGHRAAAPSAPLLPRDEPLELTQRLLSSEARVDAQRMRTGRLQDADWVRVSNSLSRLSNAPIFIDDNPNLTVMDIRAGPGG